MIELIIALIGAFFFYGICNRTGDSSHRKGGGLSDFEKYDSFNKWNKKK